MKDRNPTLSIAFGFGVSLLITLVSALILLLTLTWIAYSTPDPSALVLPLSVGALCICSFVCGFSSAKLGRDIFPPLISAAIGGVIFDLILFLLTVLPLERGSGFSGGTKVMIYLLQIGIATLGGVIGRTRGKKRKNYKKRIARR